MTSKPYFLLFSGNYFLTCFKIHPEESTIFFRLNFKMESNSSGPREEIALSEIITCSNGDENGQHAKEPSDNPAGEMTASFMEKFSLKFNKFITKPLCILIFASLLLTELICCAIKTANLFTKATSTLPEMRINPRYVKYSLTGLLLPPLLVGTALL